MKEIIELKETGVGFKKHRILSILNTPPRVLVFGFGALILCGALLLSLPLATTNGQGLAILDAVFTASSALCVTGLVVVDTGTTFTLFGQLVIIFLIQIGGIGFMTFATLFAIFMGRRITLKERLLLQEALNQISLEGIVRLARYIIAISLLIESLGAIILTLNWYPELGWGKAAYFGIFHAISAFNNAGFDLFGNYSSLTSFTSNVITNVTIMFLIITGGLGFVVLSDLYTFKGKRFTLHSRLVMQVSVILIGFGSLFIFLLEFSNTASLANLDPGSRILAAVFQSVASRTAGFNTIDIATLRDSTLIVLILLMFIGASPGSTGGGIKTTTFITILLSVISTFKGSCNTTYQERTIPKEIIQKSVAIAFVALALICVVTLILSATENSDLLTLLFETVSAFGTVGLSMGITPKLTSYGKVAIIFTMFCGRVGPLTLAFALGQQRKRVSGQSEIKYPEEKLIIG